MTKLPAEQLLFHLVRLYFSLGVCSKDVETDPATADGFGGEFGGGAESPRSAGCPRAIARRLVAVEEEFTRLSRSEELIDEVNDLGIGKEVFQQRWVVVAAEVEGLLKLGGEPPVPLIHRRPSLTPLVAARFALKWAEQVVDTVQVRRYNYSLSRRLQPP